MSGMSQTPRTPVRSLVVITSRTLVTRGGEVRPTRLPAGARPTVCHGYETLDGLWYGLCSFITALVLKGAWYPKCPSLWGLSASRNTAFLALWPFWSVRFGSIKLRTYTFYACAHTQYMSPRRTRMEKFFSFPRVTPWLHRRLIPLKEILIMRFAIMFSLTVFSRHSTNLVTEPERGLRSPTRTLCGRQQPSSWNNSWVCW